MARIGFTKCACCGNPEASISRTGTGTLSLTCHRCEFSGFAKMGTKAHRLTTAGMTLDDDAPTDLAPKVQPKTAKQSAKSSPDEPEQKSAAFSLGDL